MNIFFVSQVLCWEGNQMTLRTLQLKFCFPPFYGVYDTGDGTIYIFGEYDGEIEDVISHEVLHWTLQKVAGKKASLALDDVPLDLLKA